MSQKKKITANSLEISIGWTDVILVHPNMERLRLLQNILGECKLYFPRTTGFSRETLSIKEIQEAKGVALTIADASAKMVGIEIIPKEWVTAHEAIEVFDNIPDNHKEEVEKFHAQYNNSNSESSDADD